jgi:hypothetical protein
MVLNKVAMFSSFEILITFSVTILLQIAFSGVNHGGTNAAPSRPSQIFCLIFLF